MEFTGEGYGVERTTSDSSALRPSQRTDARRPRDSSGGPTYGDPGIAGSAPYGEHTQRSTTVKSPTDEEFPGGDVPEARRSGRISNKNANATGNPGMSNKKECKKSRLGAVGNRAWPRGWGGQKQKTGNEE
jgi:hypothetical protein